MMPFKKGQPKHPDSGMKKGQKVKNKIIKISTFLAESNINIAKELYDCIQSIQDPVAKSKMLLDYYKFVDAQMKESIVDSNEFEPEEPSTLISIISDSDKK